MDILCGTRRVPWHTQAGHGKYPTDLEPGAPPKQPGAEIRNATLAAIFVNSLCCACGLALTSHHTSPKVGVLRVYLVHVVLVAGWARQGRPHNQWQGLPMPPKKQNKQAQQPSRQNRKQERMGSKGCIMACASTKEQRTKSVAALPAAS